MSKHKKSRSFADELTELPKTRTKSASSGGTCRNPVPRSHHKRKPSRSHKKKPAEPPPPPPPPPRSARRPEVGSSVTWSFLLDACNRGDATYASRVISRGATPDVLSQEALRRTPLYAACKLRRVGLATVLIGSGADLNHRDAKQKTPLHAAATGGSTELVEKLLDAGVDPDPTDVHSESPLHIAAERGWSTSCEMLIDAGALIERVSSDGWTPLGLASLRGHAAAVSVLLERGADWGTVITQDVTDTTPLVQALFADRVRRAMVAFARGTHSAGGCRSPVHLLTGLHPVLARICALVAKY